MWVLVYWIIDVKKWKRWTAIVKPAGANALFAYILSEFLFIAFEHMAVPLGFDFHHFLGSSFAIGVWRSLIFAFAVTWLAGWLRRFNICPKL
jgi:predicted acyltransferase